MNSVNFKKWAFHFMIWIIIINIITIYLTISYTSIFNTQNNTGEILLYFGIIATILLLLSITFIILSSIKKEKRNYQYWISIVGIFIFGVLPIIASFF
jgi:small-conductance mechanosensitive channel